MHHGICYTHYVAAKKPSDGRGCCLTPLYSSGGSAGLEQGLSAASGFGRSAKCAKVPSIKPTGSDRDPTGWTPKLRAIDEHGGQTGRCGDARSDSRRKTKSSCSRGDRTLCCEAIEGVGAGRGQRTLNLSVGRSTPSWQWPCRSLPA
jgi:hypothetical protein